jgi:hypothetical protein
LFFFFFFGYTGVWTRDLIFARQVLYHLSHSASPFPSLINSLPFSQKDTFLKCKTKENRIATFQLIFIVLRIKANLLHWTN